MTDGVAGAFEAFKAKNPNLVFRRIFDYGYGGQGFVLAAGAAADGAPSHAGSILIRRPSWTTFGLSGRGASRAVERREPAYP